MVTAVMVFGWQKMEHLQKKARKAARTASHHYVYIYSCAHQPLQPDNLINYYRMYPDVFGMHQLGSCFRSGLQESAVFGPPHQTLTK